MKRILIRLTALVVILTMAFPFTVGAATKNAEVGSSEDSATRLYQLGLAKGTGNGFELGGQATRLHGVIMLLRLMGEESSALDCKSVCPFTDVVGYGKPYLAYAKEKGYAMGRTLTTFAPDDNIDFKSYVTFLLRVLGYDDTKDDFSWAKSVEKAAEIGMMDLASANLIAENNFVFYRADMFDLSLCALTMNMKGKTTTLAEELVRRGVFTYEQGIAQGVLNTEKIRYVYESKDISTISRTTNTYTLPSGKVSADVITVNTLNPKVSVKACLVNNTIGATDTFSNIVVQSGADVVINSNFFSAYQAHKAPIGLVMCDGQFLYTGDTLPQFGFTEDGYIETGAPAIVFTATSGKLSWTCFQSNMNNNDYTYGIVYNSAFGPSVTVNATEGVVATVRNGIFTECRAVQTHDVIAIPEDGYLLFFGKAFTSTDYYRNPIVGESVTIEPTFFRGQDDGFSLDGVEHIVSGAPCLVDNGEICTVLPVGFQEERFTTMVTPRTAIGKLANGKLLIVSTSAASIQQMRELMLELGCVEAINLDGGGSTALAYEGKIIRAPARQLTTTLHVFVED